MDDRPVEAVDPPKEPGQPPPKDEPAKPPAPMTPAPPAPPSPWRLMVGRDLVALGFVVVIATVGMSILFLAPDATAIATAIAPVLTLVGTLVGAVFGVELGNRGRQEDSQARGEAETRAVEAAALLEPEAGRLLVESWRNSSPRGNP